MLYSVSAAELYTTVNKLVKHWFIFHHFTLYRASQEERSIFWEVIVSVILSRKVYTYMCPIPNGFWDRAISLYCTLYTVQTSNTTCPHTSCKVHWYWRCNFQKCIILRKLYQLCRFNNKYQYQKQYVLPLSYQQFGSVQWNSAISEIIRNTTCTYTLFAQNDWYYDLPEYWSFLLGHPVYSESSVQWTLPPHSISTFLTAPPPPPPHHHHHHQKVKSIIMLSLESYYILFSVYNGNQTPILQEISSKIL
jgi:hypothetical protein